jgi:cytochrome c oxidase cbb3-type subunit III
MSEVKRRDEIAGDIVHEYDGIEEADNALPVWWVVVFVLSIVFAGSYWTLAERLQRIPSPAQEAASIAAERAKRSGVVDDAQLLAAKDSAIQVAAGQKLFATNCIACHGSSGEGNIGPNLTDTAWLHGGSPASIFGTIRDGVPAKGMPAWGAMLGTDHVKSVAAYVLSVRNTNVAGKPAQGEAYSGI